MPPTHVSPSAKPTIWRYLTFSEREDIAIEVARGTGINAIARKLGRSPSTISRELKRNAATRSGSLILAHSDTSLLFAPIFTVHFFNSAALAMTVGLICANAVPPRLTGTVSGLVVRTC
ncbi:Helix-turn-helix domain-containing protein [Sphingobium sp. AP50]|nr:Helix-turn-helix domain-containing protein [Sphingobium sp. AP50]